MELGGDGAEAAADAAPRSGGGSPLAAAEPRACARRLRTPPPRRVRDGYKLFRTPTRDRRAVGKLLVVNLIPSGNNSGV